MAGVIDALVGQVLYAEVGPVWNSTTNLPITNLVWNSSGFQIRYRFRDTSGAIARGTLTLAASGDYSVIAGTSGAAGYYYVLIPISGDDLNTEFPCLALTFEGSATGAYDFPGQTYRLINQNAFDAFYADADDAPPIIITPSDPDLATGYLVCYDADMEVVTVAGSVTMTLTLESLPSGSQGLAPLGSSRSDTNDTSGVVQWTNLIPGATYVVTAPTNGNRQRVTIPSTAGDTTVQLNSLLR